MDWKNACARGGVLHALRNIQVLGMKFDMRRCRSYGVVGAVSLRGWQCLLDSWRCVQARAKALCCRSDMLLRARINKTLFLRGSGTLISQSWWWLGYKLDPWTTARHENLDWSVHENIHSLASRAMVVLMNKGLRKMWVSTHDKPCLRLNPGHAAIDIWMRKVSVDHVWSFWREWTSLSWCIFRIGNARARRRTVDEAFSVSKCPISELWGLVN